MGLPIGDTSDGYSLALSLDGRYLTDVGENFEIGGATGILYGLGKSIDVAGVSVDVDDVSFLPIAATGRYEFNEKFEVGLDLGFAIGLDNDGGLYYYPHATYELTDNLELIGGFRGISTDGANFNLLNFGIEFEIGD